MNAKEMRYTSPKALQSRGESPSECMLPQKISKFKSSEMPFPALSTGHFNKYERKCKWLELAAVVKEKG